MSAAIQSLVFDLDDTLVVEEASADDALLQTCALAEERYGIPATNLRATVRQTCRELWHASPARAYCVAVGISSWEGLWAKFTGDGAELQRLRAWAPTYRFQSWQNALQRYGIDDPGLAEELAETFPRLRRERHIVYDDVIPTLTQLAGSYSLGLLTNGAADLQRFKIQATGLGDYFQEILVAGEIGVGKPDARAYEQMLDRLGVKAENACMIGDHLVRDVAGAQQAGMRTVWLNREGKTPMENICPDWEINSLAILPAILRDAREG